MSELTDKDKMIAYLITQIQENQKRLNEANDKILELTQKKSDPVVSEKAISLSQLQSLVPTTMTVSEKTEKDIATAIDLILKNKAVFGF